jgi:DNA repair exonuclease SbcCD ATPase subunit
MPKTGTLDDLLGMLRHADKICDLGASTGKPCPLCKRELGQSEVALFKQYHELISDELDKEINKLKEDIKTAEATAKNVKRTDYKRWSGFEMIPVKTVQNAQAWTKHLIDDCDITKEPSDANKQTYEMLKALVVGTNTFSAQKDAAIATATTSKQELLKQLKAVQAEIDPLAYGKLIKDNLGDLKAVREIVGEVRFWDEMLPQFTTVLKKITDFCCTPSFLRQACAGGIL